MRRTGSAGGKQQFAHPAGARRQRVALLRPEELQPAGLGHLHDGRPAREPETGAHGPAERVGHQRRPDFAAQRGCEHVERPFPAVGEGQLHDLPVGRTQHGRHLPRREAAFK